MKKNSAKREIFSACHFAIFISILSHMLMRVSIGIHLDDLDAAIETYELMSKKYFTHATPTLFNAGTPKPQMSSCFLLTMGL